MSLSMINRTGADALIPQQVANEIIQALPTKSHFLALARRLPNMTAKQTRIPVMTGLATAQFVSGDTGKKPTTNLTWDNVFITAEEIAVNVPIPEAVLDDATYDIWAEARPRIAEAFARAIDAAALFGVNRPSTWPVGIVPGAIAAGNVVNYYPGANNDIYGQIMGEDGVIAKVEEGGVGVDAYMAALKMRAKLRGARDLNGQPIFHTAYSNGVNGASNYEIDGHMIDFPDNGSWVDDDALMIAGNFKHAVYAIRQDITFKIFDQGVITNDDGTVALSLMEQDCVNMRAVIRLGWALPKPVNAVSGRNYYPFAVLQPANAIEVSALTYNVTAPVKSAVPQSTHAAGTGYTATITWSPVADAFAASTVYTATVVYTAADGHIFDDSFGKSDVDGLPATSGSGKAATSVTVTRDSNTQVTVVAKYLATAE